MKRGKRRKHGARRVFQIRAYIEEPDGTSTMIHGVTTREFLELYYSMRDIQSSVKYVPVRGQLKSPWRPYEWGVKGITDDGAVIEMYRTLPR